MSGGRGIARYASTAACTSPGASPLACRYELPEGRPQNPSRLDSPLEPLDPGALAAFSGNRAWSTPRHFYALPVQRHLQLHACPESPTGTCAEIETGVDYATGSGVYELRSLAADPVGRVLALSNPTYGRGGLEIFEAGTGPQPTLAPPPPAPPTNAAPAPTCGPDRRRRNRRRASGWASPSTGPPHTRSPAAPAISASVSSRASPVARRANPGGFARIGRSVKKHRKSAATCPAV